MSTAFVTMSLLVLSSPALPASSPESGAPVVVGLVNGRDRFSGIAVHVPADGWLNVELATNAPQTGEVIHVFSGAELRRMSVAGFPARSDVSAWNAMELMGAHSSCFPDDFRLGVAEGPLRPVPLQFVRTTNAEAVRMAGDYLRTKNLDVPRPRLSQVARADVDGDGLVDWLLTARSHLRRPASRQSGPVYSVALFVSGAKREQIVPLASQTSFKLAEQSAAEFERAMGPLHEHRMLAAFDANGDGRLEIIFLVLGEDHSRADIVTVQDGKAVRLATNAVVP